MIALSVTFGASSPRGGAFGKPVKLILAEQSILYRKMPGLAYGGRHCDTSFIFVVDVMKQKEKPVKNYKMLEPARKLRREMTPQERKLWYAFLKDYPVKIYKQRIIESYIVDFYCAKAGLVIELDGPIHKHEQNIQHDANRDERLKSYGLEILGRYALTSMPSFNAVPSDRPASAVLDSRAKNQKSRRRIRRSCPACQWLPLWGSWHSAAVTERAIAYYKQ